MTGSPTENRDRIRRKPAVASARVLTAMPGGEVILYDASDGGAHLDVRLDRESVWLSQKQMALLFDTERSVISKHLKNIFASGELERESNVQKMHIAGSDRPVEFFHLDAILSVGYRVNSKRGTRFRIWATGVLRDHLIKARHARRDHAPHRRERPLRAREHRAHRRASPARSPACGGRPPEVTARFGLFGDLEEMVKAAGCAPGLIWRRR